MLGILMNWGLMGVLTNQTCECVLNVRSRKRLIDYVHQTCTIVTTLTTDSPFNAWVWASLVTGQYLF